MDGKKETSNSKCTSSRDFLFDFLGLEQFRRDRESGEGGENGRPRGEDNVGRQSQDMGEEA
jgi:hypothetical protein